MLLLDATVDAASFAPRASFTTLIDMKQVTVEYAALPAAKLCFYAKSKSVATLRRGGVSDARMLDDHLLSWKKFYDTVPKKC